MASVLPAMRGKFGNTEYYIVTMPAKELTERLIVPQDIEGWAEISIEERYQREINYNRVKRQIAPYLVEDEDRFFGAFIVSMLKAENIEFEPIDDVLKVTTPKLYRVAGSAFGFLTLQGRELLVPLDGQHRLAALEFAISGKDEKQQPIANFEACTDVAEDVCTVILIVHDDVKSRKIFNKVNRYAKRTTKAENLITADDDIIAVIVRESILGVDNAIPDRLVNIKGNTLSARACEFTTLSTLYESTKCLLEDTHSRIDTERLPDKPKQIVLRNEAVQFWETVCAEVQIFSNALHDSGEQGDERRREIRADYLLGKPVAQLALVQAIVRLCKENDETGVRLGLKEVCGRVNQLNWRSSEPRWQQVLMNGDRVVSGRAAVNFASQVIAYWLGEEFSDGDVKELRERYESHGATAQLAAPVQLV